MERSGVNGVRRPTKWDEDRYDRADGRNEMITAIVIIINIITLQSDDALSEGGIGLTFPCGKYTECFTFACQINRVQTVNAFVS